MERAWSYLVDLCASGPRTTGTRGERAAANRIAGWLGRMGYRVERQLFWAPKATLYWGPAIVLCLLTVALALGLQWPWLGLGLALLALLPLLGELLGFWPDLGTILPQAPSQNVLGHLRSSGEFRQRLVLVAHMDTQRAGLLFHPRLVRALPVYFNLTYGLLGLAVGALIVRMTMPEWWGAGPGSAVQPELVPAASANVMRWFPGALAGPTWPVWACLILALLLLLNGLFLWWCGLTAGETIGANDNGSGVALALSLGEYLVAHRPPGVEVLLLFTGAEEVGSRGMRRFLNERTYGPETIFINLDNLGAGELHVLEGEGMGRYYRYDPELLAVALGVAAPGELKRRRNLLLPTDAGPAAAAGCRVITFIGFAPDGSIPNYHWPTDRLDGIDQLQLTRTERFLRRYLAALIDSASTGQPRQGW